MALVWQDARKKAQNTLDEYWDGEFPVKVSAISKAMGVTPLPGFAAGRHLRHDHQGTRPGGPFLCRCRRTRPA